MRLRGRRKTYVSLLVLVLTLSVYFAQRQGWIGDIGQVAEINQPGLYHVVHYDDGDTIVVDMNGTPETLRFIGIDTPETHDPRKPVQCYGPQASAFTKQLISSAGNEVRLAADPQSTDRDRYDRLLRYIYLPDGRLVQEELLKNGYAFYYPYFPFTKSTLFAADQANAKQAHRGLWQHCQPTPTDAGGYTSNALKI